MVAAVISSRDIVSLKPEKVRLARAKAIDSLHIELPASRAQYNTYLEEPGVSPESKTETFFSLSATVRSKKHAAVKVLLSAGKGLSENGVDIRLVFKKPISLKEGVVNEAIFALNTNNFMEAYERVFLAAIERDLRYFCSLEESVAGWKFTDAVTSFWKKKQISLQHYDIGEDIYVPKKGRA
jgi:glucose-6-phosphate 1-dehydrogenase